MGGFNVVSNERNDLVSMWSVTKWSVFMDYRKLNAWTEKDHFSFPFMDQILDRLVKKGWSFFLYGYSGCNQISLSLEDEAKTAFICPYGTFSFKRMPFRLCNASTTFQRCMLSIFSKMVEDSIEVLMDELLVVGNSLDKCF